MFLNKYTNSNGYKSAIKPLRLGDYVTIQDGTYNSEWMIAGFDVEHNQTAADGIVYDNGYGIALVPVTQVTTGYWNGSESTTGGYMSSYMHTTTLPTVTTNLKKVLGSHLIQRNVLLSSAVSKYNGCSAYTWTTAYCTLMSVGQMTGTFASYKNKYDDGEANYKLPVFNNIGYNSSTFWTRNVSGSSGVYVVNHNSKGDYINNYTETVSTGVRPLIYIR